MKPHRLAAWTLLGSNLWLRPVERADLPRLKTFRARRDLVRSARSLGEALDHPGRRAARFVAGRNLALVATDPSGAPAGVFVLADAAEEGGASVAFAVPRDGAQELREALRLLADAARYRSGLRFLEVQASAEAHFLDRLLTGLGWRSSGDGAWRLDLRGEDGHED